MSLTYNRNPSHGTIARSVANHYPVDHRNALVAAAAFGDVETIDRITDELAAQGLCRKRSDESMLDELRARAGWKAVE